MVNPLYTGIRSWFHYPFLDQGWLRIWSDFVCVNVRFIMFYLTLYLGGFMDYARLHIIYYAAYVFIVAMGTFAVAAIWRGRQK